VCFIFLAVKVKKLKIKVKNGSPVFNESLLFIYEEQGSSSISPMLLKKDNYAHDCLTSKMA